MMETCKRCGKEVLTEAQPHAVLPQNTGYHINCGCYFKQAMLDKIIDLIKDETIYYGGCNAPVTKIVNMIKQKYGGKDECDGAVHDMLEG